MTAIAAPTLGSLSAPERRAEPATATAPRSSTLTGGPLGVQEFRVPFPGGELIVSIEREPPIWVSPVLNALGQLLAMPEGWDSYGARAVDPANARAAIELALTLMHDRTPPPLVVPTSAGGVQLEWHSRGIDLEVEIRSSSRISACFADQHSNRAWDAEQLYDFSRLRDALRDLAMR